MVSLFIVKYKVRERWKMKAGRNRVSFSVWNETGAKRKKKFQASSLDSWYGTKQRDIKDTNSIIHSARENKMKYKQ